MELHTHVYHHMGYILAKGQNLFYRIVPLYGFGTYDSIGRWPPHTVLLVNHHYSIGICRNRLISLNKDKDIRDDSHV